MDLCALAARHVEATADLPSRVFAQSEARRPRRNVIRSIGVR